MSFNPPHRSDSFPYHTQERDIHQPSRPVMRPVRPGVSPASVRHCSPRASAATTNRRTERNGAGSSPACTGASRRDGRRGGRQRAQRGGVLSSGAWVKAGNMVAAGRPIMAKASTARSRTKSSSSARRSRSDGTAGLATGPRLARTAQALGGSSLSALVKAGTVRTPVDCPCQPEQRPIKASKPARFSQICRWVMTRSARCPTLRIRV